MWAGRELDDVVIPSADFTWTKGCLRNGAEGTTESKNAMVLHGGPRLHRKRTSLLKAAIKAVHRRQMETNWTEAWAAESKGKEPLALPPAPSNQVKK